MNFSRTKATAIAITVLLAFSLTASMMLLPNASAHSPPWNNQLFAFINVAPNPCGLGQSITIGFWLNQPPPTASTAYGDRWTNMTIHVTLPDGTTATLGPFTSDDVGGSSTQYTPTELGSYTFQMFYGGQVLAGSNPPPTGYSAAADANFIGDNYLPAQSSIATLTVQSTPLPLVPVTPLPTTYWQTPVSALNVNNWYAITGPSLDLAGAYGASASGGRYNFSSNYNPYTTAPLTAHVMWTIPAAFGGVLGGDAGGTGTSNYYATAQYERKYNPIIINGYLYYTEFPGSSTSPTGSVCVNLYTGKTVWTDDSTNYGGGSPEQTALTTAGIVTLLRCGQALDYQTPNQFGGIAYLWTTGNLAGINEQAGTTMWNMFDAMTGKYILSIVNGSSLTLTVDAGGNLIGYYVNATAGTQIVNGVKVTSTGPTLNEWNSTWCIINYGNITGQNTNPWEWRPPQTTQIPFADGLEYSVPLNTTYDGAALPANMAIWAINSGTIIMDSDSGVSFFTGGYIIFAAYNQNTGQQLWMENVTTTPFTDFSLNNNWMAGNGIFTTIAQGPDVLNAYSMTTGALVWTDNLASQSDPYDSEGGYMGTIAGQNLYLFGFGGDVWSINMLNGDINWYTNTTVIQGPAGLNSPYGTWPIWEQSGIGVADGIIFLGEGHEYSPPLFHGAQELALNATNGQLVWSMEAFDVNALPVTAYGIMTTINAYDNQIYAWGMGPSQTTVNAPGVGVTTATPVTITGTVMDLSAGAKQEAVAANFPAGLPCVSDASMSQYMEAVYEQQPMPTNITGVPVTLSVVDANGNTRTIGTTTTDSSGTFAYNWKPDIPGNFTVIATFPGTNSYYGSCAEAHFYASTPASTTAPTPAPASNTNTYVMEIGIAIIVVIIVVGAILAMLMLRKRP